MTMPKTAIGIAENSSCEKTASCALQMRSIVFVAAIAATRLICARKDVMPSLAHFPSKCARGRKLSFCR